MALLPSAGSNDTIGVLITTTAENGAITTTQAQLQVLGDTAKNAGKQAASSFDTFNKNLKNVGQQMTDVGRSMSTYISLPIIGVATASTKMAMQFQQDMEVLATNANVPQSAIAGLSQSILALAPKVGAGPDALAKAMYHVASATPGVFNAAKEMAILQTAAEGAAIGQANLDDTTYALTAALSSNVSGAKDANQMMGTLLATVGAGDMTMQNLNDAIGTGFLGTMQSFGVSIQSVGAALATLGDNGERGAAAATRLRMMVTLMTSPSAAAAKILGDLGLTTGETATATGAMNDVFAKTGLTTTTLADDLQKPNGINVAIKDIKSHLEDAHMTAGQTDAILAKAFGGGRTDAALLQLISNVDKTDQKFGQVNKDSTNFGNNWAQQQKTAKQQWDQSWSGIQSDMIKLGVTIMPQVTHGMNDVAKAVTGVTNWFAHLSGGQKQFVIDAAGVLAVSGPVLMFFGGVAKGISNIIDLAQGPFGQAMRAMATAAFNAADQIVANMTGGVGIKMAVQNLVSYVGGPAALAPWGVFAAAAVVAFLAIQKSANDTKAVIDNMQKGINSDFASINNAISQVGNLAKTGTPAQQARAKALLQSGVLSADANAPNNSSNPFSSFLTGLKSLGLATGTNYARGGWSMVGENGPEMMYVPQGSTVKTNGQSGGTTNNHSTNIYGNIILPNVTNPQEFMRALNQDTLNVGRGLTPVQGRY